MKKNNLHQISIALLIISLTVFLLILYVHSLVLLEKKEIITTLKVGENAKFEINKTALTFGTIPPSSTVYRNITIENHYPFPIKAKFRVKGNIKKFLIFEKIIHFEIKDKKEIIIKTISPEKKDYGNYSGKILITIQKDI